MLGHIREVQSRALRQVVEANDVMASCEKLRDEIGAYEPGRTGDEDSQLRASTRVGGLSRLALGALTAPGAYRRSPYACLIPWRRVGGDWSCASVPLAPTVLVTERRPVRL